MRTVVTNRKKKRDYKSVEMTKKYEDSSDESQDDSDVPFKKGGSEEDSTSSEVDGSYEESEEEDSSGYDEIKLNLYQACGLNTMNMFGTGPFITIPFVVAAADPPGPQALIGYACAAFACMNDSLVWSELGSIWPDSGGSYVYLRELFGRNSWGRLMAFLFVWQIMVSGPMECASGFIATAQYIAYIDGVTTYIHHAMIAFGMCLATTWALYREIDEVGTITLILWAFTIAAITFAIIAGYASFKPKYIEAPSNAYADGSRFFISLGTAARFAVYDFTGYYDVCFVGEEVQNPSENIPIACVVTCVVVAMCFFLVDIAVIGSLEWNPMADPPGYVELVTSGADSANYIMAIFCEQMISRDFAIFFTIIVVITIFGSCFSFMIGLAQIPYTAAKDGYFYVFLAHQHPTMKGLSDYSLLFVGGLSTIFCFLELEIVIEGMLTMQLLIQFMLQGFGLMYYRYLVHEDDQEEAPFPCPAFPIPCIIQLVIFGFIFSTTDTYAFHGNAPLLEVALSFIIMGVVCYMLWARTNGFWPYGAEALDSDEEGLDHLVVYVDDGKYNDEFGMLKKRLAFKEAEVDRLKKLDSESHDLVQNRASDLKNTEEALDNKAYRIEQLFKKLELQESKLNELMDQLADKEKEVTDAKMENAQLRRKLGALQFEFGITESSSDEYGPGDSDDEDGVLGWGVNEVIGWWKENLPKGAQDFVPVVEECHLTGKDLIELDKEMLEQLGIKKLLVMKILKQIEPLRIDANLPPRTGLDDYSDRASKSAERRGNSRNYGDDGTIRRSRSRGDHGDSEPAWGWDRDSADRQGRAAEPVGITSV